MKNLLYLLLITLLFNACTQPYADKKTEANKQGVQRFYDQVVNAHNPAMIDSFCTTDFTDHNPSPGHTGKGSDDLKAEFKEFFASVPDLRMTPNIIVVNGDTAMVQFTMTGTNSGPMMGRPGTNKSVNVQGTDVLILKDGKATDRWGYFEEGKWMKQLGMMPDMPM